MTSTLSQPERVPISDEKPLCRTYQLILSLALAMMRILLYDLNVKSMATTQEPYNLRPLSIGDLEALIVEAVSDHKRLIYETLQLENYLFSPVTSDEANEKKKQIKKNVNGPFCDWGLKLHQESLEYSISKIVKQARKMALEQQSSYIKTSKKLVRVKK